MSEQQPDDTAYLLKQPKTRLLHLIYLRPHPLGGAVASKPFQRQLAAHLCELEPEGRSLAGLPGGEAEGRRSGAGNRTSHQTWRSACTGAGTGE